MKKQPQAEEEFDVTELMAAIALLNGEELPAGPVFVPASTFPFKKEEAAKRAANPEPGDEMPDGTIYLGLSKDKDGAEKKWFAAAEDARDDNGQRLSLEFNEAVQYAGKSKAHGHRDWMLPPGRNNRGEPDVLGSMFNIRSNGALEGTFNETSVNRASWYWSSSSVCDPGSPHWKNASYLNADNCAEAQHFKDGHQSNWNKEFSMSIRLVRSVTVQKATP